MEKITELIKKLPEYKQLHDAVYTATTPVAVVGVSAIHKAHLIAALKSDMKRPVVVICADDSSAAKMAQNIAAFTEKPVDTIPFRDFVFHNIESSSRQYEHERISVLSEMKKGKKTVVASVAAMLMAALPPSVMDYASFTIKFSGNYDVRELAEKLILAGYRRCMQVEGEGQFSLRGGILDVFPPGERQPVRIEFFGDEVDTMSYFDIGSQRRGESVESLTCLPNLEALPSMAKGGVSGLVEALKKIIDSRGKKHQDLEKNIRRDIERLQNDGIFPAADKYMPLIYPEMATALDYIPEHALVFLDDVPRIREHARIFNVRLSEDIEALMERGLLSGQHAGFALNFPQLVENLSHKPMIYMDTFLSSCAEMPPRAIVNIQAKELNCYGGNLQTAALDIEMYQKQGFQTVVLCGGDLRRKNMSDALSDIGVPCAITDKMPKSGKVAIMEGSLSAGFEYPALQFALITEGQVLGLRKETKAKLRKTNRDRVKSYTDLTPGDIVVHEHHGIGRFVGMERMKVDGGDRDFVKIAFAGTDFLYVPATNLDLVSKYIGSGGDEGTVRLNKLGGADWQKARTKAKAAAKELAAKLIALYAERQRLKGFAFPEDDNWQREFEGAFEFEETEDQIRCVEEIKQDMQSDRPMDRLLCGDVGFGKTEVAMRAIMKCVMGGKQAAILVPTTVLARQHYLTAIARFSAYPVKIEMLSRFKTAKEQKIILERLKSGGIDLLIGTHKLFIKDLKFYDLGLLVVDEEQRFGVTHKEQLKTITKQVDVLTLSATPIPRTLNMALSGIRDMSVIEQPPRDRHPVQTYVMEYDFGVVIDALRREFYRGGQSYYVHNRVESIDSMALKIKKELPEAEIAVVHGKMSQRELGKIMTKMSDGDIDILVCTTIIETGIDIPNANTLIIENADKMGLAQLHQIRGRVGRSARHAFAYFTYQKGKVLSEIAQKRLSAIREFAEFGSGFKIAMRDLEIRGAGNVLGPEQSGHLMTVGYDLYLKLLEEAVLEEKGETAPKRVECAADIMVNANIPQDYVTDAGQRVDLYRRIALIRTEADREDMLDELIDRFGEPPVCVVHLCDIALLRTHAAANGIVEIKQSEGRLIVKWDTPDFARLSALCGVKLYMGRLLLNAGSQPYVSLRLNKDEEPLPMAKKLIALYADTKPDKKENAEET